MASEAIPQSASCRVSDASPTISMTPATSSAPRPNQITKNAGIASSSRISRMPPTAQYHHSIVISTPFSMKRLYGATPG
ncbi:hypothetical protein D3C77_731760 [compost metagenome]